MDSLVLVGAGVVAVGLCARVTEGSWVAPVVLFPLLWGIYLISAAALIVDPEVALGGFLWIAGSCVLVYGGALFTRAALPSPLAAARPPGAVRPNFPYLLLLTSACVAAGIVEVGYLFARQGYSWRTLLSFSVIAQLSAANRAEYGYGDLQQGLGERLAFILLYLGPLFGGILFKTGTRLRDRVVGVLSVVLPILVGGLYGSRMGVLYGGSFWVSAYLAASVLQAPVEGRTGFRLLVRAGLVTAFLLLGLSLLTQVVRYAAGSGPFDWFRMLADPFGFVAAFGTWFDGDGVRTADFYLGARSLRRVVEFAGIRQPLAPAIEVGFTSSNVYTVFRDLIEDYGSVGALVAVFVYGMVATGAYQRVVAGWLGYVPWLTLVFALALTSFAISIFLYTVTSVAVALFLGYFAVARATWVPAGTGGRWGVG